jgi:glutamate formiminotransferase
VVDAIASAIRGVSRVKLLDYSSDVSHHRSVFTMVGTARPLEEAVTALFLRASEDLDMRTHRGVHPRLGAVDVVPFVPLAGCTIAECVELARHVGRRIADQFHVPVYLYGEAASRPARRQLPDIRRGQFEGLAARMASPDWLPDFGPHRPHPTLGASVVGVRRLLVAYNVNLRSGRLDVATAIASAIRQSSGGLPGVQAMGVPLTERGIVQVSINLIDHTTTKLIDVFNAVKLEARGYGVDVLESEIVGLTPAAALEGTTPAELQLTGFSADKVLENRLASFDPRSMAPDSLISTHQEPGTKDRN